MGYNRSAPMPDNRFPRLVSLACHDLRTPLATVYGFARTRTRVRALAGERGGSSGRHRRAAEGSRRARCAARDRGARRCLRARGRDVARDALAAEFVSALLE